MPVAHGLTVRAITRAIPVLAVGSQPVDQKFLRIFVFFVADPVGKLTHPARHCSFATSALKKYFVGGQIFY
jgi:hypothetical protein